MVRDTNPLVVHEGDDPEPSQTTLFCQDLPMSWLLDYFDAWNRNDGAAVASYMTEDIVYEDMALRHRVEGNDQIPTFVQQSEEFVPGATFDVTSHVVTDDGYTAEWIMQPMGVHGASVGTLRDGKIATNRDYWSRNHLKLPKPAAEA